MKKLAASILFTAFGFVTVFAGPVRPVPSGLFTQQAPAPNGPNPDPTAMMGQWFVNVTNGIESARKWELHDDLADTFCIEGHVVAIQWGSGMGGGHTNIAGFTILATVVNNPAGVAGVSSNSHLEVQMPPLPQFAGTMHKTRIAAEFAVAEAGPGGPPYVGVAPSIPGMGPPYFYAGSPTNVIEAVNEDLAAWYCFQPPDPINPVNPPGAYYVPAWELGDIPPGANAQVLMQFQIKNYGGAPSEMPWTDIRHSVIRHSFMNGSDVLYNRSDSLKISHWLDLMLVDVGWAIQSVWYPELEEEPLEYITASDVSVFFNASSSATPTVLNITPQFTNQTFSAAQLDWMAPDVGPFILQYCDNLASNNWNSLLITPPLPPAIPGPMQWTDDGTFISPPLQSPRFYRLLLP